MNTFETDKKKEPPEKARSTVGDARGVTQTAAAAGGDSPLENFMAARRGADQPDAIMENWLAALDEFDHWKTNPTLFNSMELDPAWLNMKDVPLLAASAPATGTPADRDALSVPDTVFPLVRDLQMAIGYLEQSATGVWIDRLERQTGFWLAGRVRATISTVGAALAEAMTALCDSASLAGTDPGALSRQEESAGVTALAGDVLNLLGPADVIRLVDAGGGETGDLLAGDPDEKVLRARLTAVLAPQLRATVTSTPALQDNLAALTRLRVKDYYTARHGTLGESVDKLQRARAKSARLREAVSAHVNPGLDDRAFRLVKNLKTPGELSGVRRRAEMKALIAPLMRALEECEKTLGSAADRITVVRAGALNTLVRLFDEKVTDSTLVNHFRKKLTGIRRAVSKAAPYFAGPDRMVADLFQPRDPKSPLRGKMKAKKPGTLATLIDNLVQPGDPDSLLPAEKKSALSARIADRLQSGDPKPALPEDKKIPLMALMLPLEHAARQVKSLSGPLRSGAEKLERVLSREKATDVDPVRLMREGELNLALPRLKGPELAERVFGTVLEGALNRDQGAVRLDDKVQAARDSVDALTGPLITLLPHLIRQLSEEFRTRGEGLYAAFDGNKHVTALINHAGQQAALFKAALTTFQAATAAFRAETARGPKAAAALAAAAEEISLLAGQVISDVELYTSHLLGMKYGYGGHERKLVWGLKMLVLELGGDTPESARPILDRLTTLLRDPTRTFLRRKHDPENGLLTAALEQALYDHHNDISLKMKPTAAEMVAQAPGMMDALHSKAISKTLSAALSGGLDLPTDPLYQLLRAKNLLKVLPVYGSFKAMKKMGKSAMPGQLPPEYEQDKMLDKQAVNMMLTATTTVVPSIVLLPVAAPLAVHAALTKPALFVKKVAGRLPTDVGIAGVSGGVRGGLTAAQRIHKVLHKRTMEDRLRSLAGGEMGEEDLEELLAELAEGPANGSGQVRKDPSQGDKPLGRGKRAVNDTPSLIGAEETITALSTRWKVPISPAMQVDVYLANPAYGVSQMDLKSALENKEGNILYIRGAVSDKPYINEPLMKELNDSLASLAHAEKMKFIARQMTPEQWLNFLEFKYKEFSKDGEALSMSTKVIIYSPDGEEEVVNLLDALGSEGNSRVSPASRLDHQINEDVNLYIESNKAQTLEEDVMRKRDDFYFHRTMLLYTQAQGDPGQIDKLIRNGELPESSRGFWDTIAKIKNQMDAKLLDQKNFQGITEQYNKEIRKKLGEFVPNATYEYNQSIANEIAYLKFEKEVNTSLRKGFGDAIKYLKANPVTFSEQALPRFEQSLIIAYKITFPDELEGCSDKDIYEKASAMMANKSSSRDKAQGLANMHNFVYYIASHKKEWKGDDSDIKSSNRFYQYIHASKNEGISVRSVSSHFAEATKSPAKDYNPLTTHRGIAEYWDQTDHEFYQQFEGYKALHAENEANDDIHNLSIRAGILPSDADAAPVAFKTFKIHIPVAEIRYSEFIETVKNQFNHYTPAIGNVTLFQTKSGEYWSLCTVNNSKHLTRIDKDTFDKYSTSTELNDEASVKEFYEKTGVELTSLPAPKTTSMANTYIDTTDNITFFFYHLGRKWGGHEPKQVLPNFEVEKRYYKLTSAAEVNTDNTKNINKLMVEDATQANKDMADKMKEFSTFERRNKPKDWESMTAADKLTRSLVNTYAHGKDIFFGLSAPLKVYLRSLEDKGYKPSPEDMAEAFVDLAIAGATLGYSTVAGSLSSIKKSLELVKSARALGLTGKEFKVFMFKGMAPLMKSAAKNVVTSPITEMLPGYGYYDIISSMGKSTPTLPDLGVVTDLTKKVKASNGMTVSKVESAGNGTSGVSFTESNRHLVSSPVESDLPSDEPQNLQQNPTEQQANSSAAKVAIETHDKSLGTLREYSQQAENFTTVRSPQGAEVKLTTHETNRNIVHNLVFEAHLNNTGRIYVLTGTRGSPDGYRDASYKDDESLRIDREKNGFSDNVIIIDISGKTDVEIAQIINYAGPGDTVIGAFSYSRNDTSITTSLGIKPTTSHVYPGGAFERHPTDKG